MSRVRSCCHRVWLRCLPSVFRQLIRLNASSLFVSWMPLAIMEIMLGGFGGKALCRLECVTLLSLAPFCRFAFLHSPLDRRGLLTSAVMGWSLTLVVMGGSPRPARGQLGQLEGANPAWQGAPHPQPAPDRLGATAAARSVAAAAAMAAAHSVAAAWRARPPGRVPPCSSPACLNRLCGLGHTRARSDVSVTVRFERVADTLHKRGTSRRRHRH